MQHRERLDGSGYPRGLSGGAMIPACRVLGAADAYASIREPRPHRAAGRRRTRPDSCGPRSEACLPDGAAVDAVLEAGPGTGCRGAGRPWPGRRPDRPRGRGPHPARPGLSNKQIAERLVITPKTAGNHVEHIYAKIDASSRAAAAMFAVQHGLLPGRR